MKKLLLSYLGICLFSLVSFAGDKRPYTDYWGNHYKNYDNLWEDKDGDGVIGYYDYNDRNPRVKTPADKYNNSYDIFKYNNKSKGLGGW
jgi:hypothetical protein